MPSDDSKALRQQQLQQWAFEKVEELGLAASKPIYPASDDASFRRYFRLESSKGTLICVDAPPEKEDNPSFIKVQSLLEGGQVPVPQLIAKDLEQGFMLLSDLGNRVFLDALGGRSSEAQVRLYEQALDTLCKISGTPGESLPDYDEAKLREEMMLFPGWFLTKQLGVELYNEFDRVMGLMVQNASEQPKVLVHRDYHSRNLMLLDGDELATIDFQDAVFGPITYDLVSLLKDCYWRLPRAVVVELVEKYRASRGVDVSEAQFLRWFDLMGFQRHLKCAGIFSRLNLRDGKSRYLGDIPLVVAYLIEVAEIYPELSTFGRWLNAVVQPRLAHLALDSEREPRECT